MNVIGMVNRLCSGISKELIGFANIAMITTTMDEAIFRRFIGTTFLLEGSTTFIRMY